MKFVPTHNIKLSLVGQKSVEMSGYGRKIQPIFCKADLWLNCGLTQKKQFTLGTDGILRIALDNYKSFSTKNLILQAIRDDNRDVDEYVEYSTWRKLCLDYNSTKFTNALINKIFQKVSCFKVWFHQQWWVKEIGGPSADYTLIDIEPDPYETSTKYKVKCIKCGIMSTYPHAVDPNFICGQCQGSERWNATCVECGILVYFSGKKHVIPTTFLCEPCATGEEPI